MLLCPDSPLPSLDGIIASFKPYLTFPPKLPELPNLTIVLPGLPSPLFGSLRLPNFELITAAIEMQMYQLQQTILGIVQPILSKIGTALEDFLPKIPGLNINLLDLIAGTPEKIIAAIKEAILSGFRWPGIPWPLYISLDIPDIEIMHIFKLITIDYMQTVTGLIEGIISKVTKILKIGGMPALPTLPSMGEVWEAMKGLVPDITLPDIDIMGILSKLQFPRLPSLPSIPWPLVFSFEMPDMDMIMGLMATAINNTLGVLKNIMDFIEGTLKKYLGFSFPTFCITLPDIGASDADLPEVDDPVGRL